jgi:predicted phage tail protein
VARDDPHKTLMKGAGGGGKAGGGEQHSPTEAPNTLRSKAILNLLELISEGPIKGFPYDNVAKGIVLNAGSPDNTRLMDSAGNWNFKGATIDTRLGTPSQTPMQGFTEEVTPTNVNVQVNNGGDPVANAVVRRVSDLDAVAVKVVIQLASLFKVDTASGDQNGMTIQYAIDIKAQADQVGATYVTKVNESLNDKTVSPWQKEYRINLDGTIGPWDIRIRRLTVDDPNSTVQSDLFFSLYETIFSYKLGYFNSALVGLSIDTADFGTSAPTRGYHVQGLIVKIPSNYNPVTRIYTGIWDGTFTTDYTNNPAWVLYDLLNNNRYGLGDVFTDARLTLGKWDLYSLAKYCDANNARYATKNLHSYSQDLNGNWNLNAATLVANAAVAPDGTATADKLVPTVTVAPHYGYFMSVLSGTYTFSAYVKAGGYTRAGIRVFDGAAYRMQATFDIVAGTVVNNASGAAAIQDVGDGWFRISVTGASATLGTTTGWVLETIEGTHVLQDGYAGDVTKGMYVWGLQIEAGSVATAYEKTGSGVYTDDYGAAGKHGVPDGEGGFEPRFTFNGVLRDRMGAYEAIAAILGMFRAAMIFANGQLRFLQDSPQSPAKVFTPANVVEGMFNYTGTALRARHTAVRVSWSNPDMDYLLDDILVEDPEGIERYGYNLKEETAFGCTSFGQAIRHARNILETEKLETDTVQFKIGHGEADIMPGQVFKVEDPCMTAAEWGGRLISYFGGTNKYLYSQQFDNAAWSKTNITVTANTTAAPDATVTADTLTVNAGGGNSILQFPNVVGSKIYTQSFYVKQGTGRYVELGYLGVAYGAVFDLQTGTVTAIFGKTQAYIVNVGGGWFRIIITFTPGAGEGGSYALLSVVANAAGSAYPGAGVTVFVWQGQLVEGTWPDGGSDILTTSAVVSLGVVTLDRPVTLNAGETYTITMAAPDGTLSENPITNVPGTYSTLTLSGAPVNPPPVKDALWVIGSNARTSRQFRLIVIGEDDGATYKVMGVEYNPSKFEKIDFNTDRPVPPFSGLPSASIVDPPTNVELTFLTIEDGTGAHGVLDLSWSPSTDYYLRGYRVAYQQGSDPWVMVPEQQETAFRLMDPKKGVIRFVVKALNTWGRGSEAIAIDADLTAAAGAGDSAVTPISSVYVMGSASTSWTGTDLPLQWNAQALWGLATSGTGEGLDPNFKYFRVKLLDATTNAVLSTYFTRRNRFIVPYQDMVAGGLARSYKISIEYGATDGSYSTPVITTFSNPAPSLPTGTATAKADQLTITFDPPTDPDFEGMIVWMSTTNGFTVNSGTRVWKAKGNPVIPVLPNTTYYFRYSPYDKFGETSIPISTQQTITTPQPGTDTTVSTKLAGIEDHADVTRVVDGAAAINVPYDNTGATIDGAFDVQYQLKDYLGMVTTGVTANYTVTDGTLNGFNSTSGAQAMTVTSGAATLPVTTLATDTATVRIDMIKNSITRSMAVVLTKVKAAAAPSGGGGGGFPQSQTSGFTTLITPFTSFIAMMGRIQITMPTGKTTARVTISLSPNWSPRSQTSLGPWNLEFKIQRNTGTTGSPVWTDIGATQNSNPDPYIDTDPDSGFKITHAGTMSYTFDDTGRTAGNIYEYQVVARISSGSTTGNSGGIAFTGSVALSAP